MMININNQNEYILMHIDKKVLSFTLFGKVNIYNKNLIPFGLYIEDNDTIESKTNNILNIINWLAKRVITIDRKYSKIIYNYLDLPQNNDDKTKALFSISYHSLCLTDVYWVKSKEEKISFDKINLYENSLSNSYVDIFLKGKGITINKEKLDTRDISTSGVCAKAWIRNKNNEFYLYKDGNAIEVKNELLASKIINCFKINAVSYNKGMYDKKNVSICKLITNKNYSIVNKFDYEIYCMNNGIDFYDFIYSIDPYNYYMMNIIDYLIGNDDRHPNNWGFLIDNKTNKVIRLYDLMDFNKAFKNYKKRDGGICLTTKFRITQKEAAIEAVKKIGLNCKKKINKNIFKDEKTKYTEFLRRYDLLSSYERFI